MLLKRIADDRQKRETLYFQIKINMKTHPLSVKVTNGVPQIIFSQSPDLSPMKINKAKKVLHIIGMGLLYLFMLSAMLLLPVGDYLKGTVWADITLCIFSLSWILSFGVMGISSEMNEYRKF